MCSFDTLSMIYFRCYTRRVGEMKAKVVISSDLSISHTLIKFWRHRNQCSCLDDKDQQVKHISKTGICFNAQCPNIFVVFQVGYVPRSKTKYCSRCRNVTYCSRESQVADWSKHKSACDHNAEIISKFKVFERQRYELY